MAIRLSHETDERTSPKRQTEQTQGYCDLRDWDIAHAASDLNVSGGIWPWERPDLGKWPAELFTAPLKLQTVLFMDQYQVTLDHL